jgi:predicted enzyme related to lactoylglutathione lyase
MRATAVVYVGDLARMRTFYERCFGLVVAHTAEAMDGYCRLQSEQWLLTLVQSDEARPKTSPVPRRSQTPIKLAFEVVSISAIRPLAAELGGQVDPSEWKFRDAIHCDAVDPEGNIIQLIEGTTDGPMCER